MTNAELLAKIKAEVERLENYYTSVEWYVEALLSFLSTLESEKPVPKDLEEAADDYIGKVADDGWEWETHDIVEAFIAGAKWQAEQLLKSSPLPEDTVLFNKGVAEGRRLAEEEQADLFTIVALDAAQRAKEQMLKDGNVILSEEDFDAEKEKSMEWGYNLCKEQMMKEAVEGTVYGNGEYTWVAGDIPSQFKYGDKVRIIIVKEDEK